MLKQTRASYFSNFKNAQYCALSGDPIPDYIKNGDEVYIIDTAKRCLYDADSGTLIEQPSSGGGGSSDWVNASVTFINNTPENGEYFVDTPFGVIPIEEQETIVLPLKKEDDSIFYLSLKDVIDVESSVAPSVTGDITIEENGFEIQGDGSIAFSSLAPTEISGVPPLELEDALARPLRKLLQHGKVDVNGTDVVCNNGTLKFGATGKNLYPHGTISKYSYSWYSGSKALADATNPFFLEGGKTYCLSYANTDTDAKPLLRVWKSDGTILNNEPNTLNAVMYQASSTLKFSYQSTPQYYSAPAESSVNACIISPTEDLWIDARMQSGKAEATSVMLAVSSAPLPYEPYTEGIYADGTPEEIVVSATGAEDQTAHAENLFAVGDIEDTQDIISGTVTRRTEAVVSDGTTPSGRYVGTVGEGNIIVKARETGYTGDIVSFGTEEETPLNGLVVKMEPQQDLHGYDSPWPAGGGKNLFDIDGWLTASGAPYTKSGNVYTITAVANLFSSPFQFSSADIQVTISYTDYADITTTNARIDILDANGSLVTSLTRSSSPATVTGSKLRFNWSAQGQFTIGNAQIEKGSTATPFAPFSNICPISGYTGVSVKRTGKNLFPCTDAIVNNYATIEQTSINGMPGYKITGEVGWRVSFKGLRENIKPGMSAVIVLYSDFSSSFQLNFGNLSGQHKIAPSKITTVTQISSGLYMHKATIEAYDAADACWNYTDQAVIPYGGDLTQADGVYTFSTPLYLLPDDTDYTYEPYQGETVSVTFPPVNIWDEEWEAGAYNANGSSSAVTDRIRCKNPIPVKPQTSYYFYCPNSTYWFYLFFDSQMNPLQTSVPMDTTNKAITTPDNAAFMLFYLAASYGATYNHDISINYPFETGYHAHTEPMIVYGGTPDIVSGEMPVTMAELDMGTLNWLLLSADKHLFYAYVADIKENTSASAIPNLLSDRYKTVSASAVFNAYQDFTIGQGINGIVGAKYVMAVNTDYSDAASFKTAMSGVQLVYELVTPIEIQLTPQVVETLRGLNNIWSNAGAVSVYVPTGDLIEQVAPQKLSTAEGDNTITVTAEVEDIVFDVAYRKDNSGEETLPDARGVYF